MKILVLLELADRTALTFTEPLTRIDFINSITLLRDRRLDLPKVIHPYGGKTDGNRRDSRIWKYPRKFFVGLREIKRNDIDLIYGVHLYFNGFISVLLSLISGRPCVVSIIAGEYETRMYGNLVERFLLRMLGSCEKITVTGSITRDYLVERGVPIDKVVILPNVIDHNMFFKTDIDTEFDIIWVGRLARVKNVPLLLDIVKKIKRKIPDIRVGIAGTGEELDMLKTLSSELYLDDNVSFLGFIENPNEVLNKGKIFIVTSKREGFPLATLEAMKCGLVCISSPAGDTEDIIRHGENGFIVSDWNPDSYVSIALQVLNDDAFRTKISANAISSTVLYSIEGSSERWREILEGLCEG